VRIVEWQDLPLDLEFQLALAISIQELDLKHRGRRQRTDLCLVDSELVTLQFIDDLMQALDDVSSRKNVARLDLHCWGRLIRGGGPFRWTAHYVRRERRRRGLLETCLRPVQHFKNFGALRCGEVVSGGNRLE